MTIPNTRLTRLEAVNRILRKGLGTSPILSLDPPLPPEAVTAREKLDDVQRDLEAEGWDMNTEYELELTPDGDGFIYIPQNAIRVTYSDSHRSLRNIVVRGDRLYNETDKTFVFTGDVKVGVLRLLDFTELDYALQRFIVARASLEIQGELVGNMDRIRFLADDVRNAEEAARRADNDSARYNILNAPIAAYITQRNRPGRF